MTTAAKITFCLSLLTTAALSLPAQTTASDDAVTIAATEGIRRQEATLKMQKKLAEAQSAEKKGQLSDAARLYQDAVILFPQVQIGNEAVEAQKRVVLAGSSAVRLNLARMANDRASYDEAKEQIALGLKYDPTNPALQETKARFAQEAERRNGTVPSSEVLATVPAIKKEKLDAATQVQNAKLLYEMGKYDEAEAKLKLVLKQEPGNSSAYYYLDLIKEARYKNRSRERESVAKTDIADVTKSWLRENKNELLPVPNPATRTNLIYTGEGRQRIMNKLNTIRLNEVTYDLPLVEVIKSLKDESKKRDIEGVGINFFLNSHVDAATPTPGVGGMGGMGGMNDPLMVPGALPAGALPYAAPAAPIDLGQVAIKIAVPLSDLRLADVLDLITKSSDQPIEFSIEDYGIMFSPKTPAAVQLYSKTFKVDPNTFIQGLASVMPLQVGSLDSGSGGGGGRNGGGGGGNRGGGGGNRGGGGNGGGGGGEYGEGGGLEGASVAVAPGGGMGGSGSRNGGGGGGNRGGGNRGGGMGGGLGGNTGNGGSSGDLYGPGLPFVTSTISTLALHEMVRQYFTAAGVDLTPPKCVFFNDRSGILMVRASVQDLEIIESAVELLNRAPSQLTIEAKFAEITQDDSRALGFDWFLGNTTFGGGKIGVQPGTAPSYAGQPSLANPSGFFPGPGIPVTDASGNTTYLPGPGTIPAQASDNVLTSGNRNSAGNSAVPSVATITGILTDPQFRVVIRAIEQRSGTDLLSAPKVTTLSGRQTHIAVQDMVTLVTSVDTPQTGAGGGVNLGGASTSDTGGSVASSVEYETQSMPFGPVLDVMPSVSADGYSIQMVLIPTITEFVGYDNPGQFVPQAQSVSGGNLGLPLTAVLPLPRMRVRQVVTSCNVWDGQTVVLGGLISENIQKIKDKVPLLGDLPLVGRLFRSESSATAKKNLMIFVTPTLIDPAGNRLHTDEEMPFSRTSIPTQVPVTTPEAGQ